MTEFKDASGTVWNVAIDGLVLADLREKAGVDLVQDGLYSIEEREDVLTKALLVICREQITANKLTDRQFAALLAGNVADEAIAAVRGAAELFFRPSKWSEIQSRSETRTKMNAEYQSLRPMLELLNRPDMPAAMRSAVMTAVAEQIEAVSSSPKSTGEASASGLAATPSIAAGKLLDSLESSQKA